MLVVMDKPTHEEHLYQPLQTNNKQFKITITFLTGYIGIFNVTSRNNKFYLAKSLSDEDGFIQITTPPGVFEIDSLNNEIKRIIIDEEHFTEVIYPFTIKPNFSTLESFFEMPSQRPVTTFVPDDSIRVLLGFNATTLFEEHKLSPNPDDIISFDYIILDCDIAQGMIFKAKSSGKTQNFIITVSPGCKFIRTIRGGVQWYMMESKDIFSSVCFKLKNENNQLVSINGQIITFRLSIKED